MPFLDTNIFLRHLIQDDPQKAALCTALLAVVERGEIHAWTTDLVVAELVFVLGSKRRNGYGYTREQIKNGLLPLLMLPNLQIPSKRFYPRIFELYIQHDIDFIDAVHAALVEASSSSALCSYDQDFDRVGTVVRLEPGTDI